MQSLLIFLIIINSKALKISKRMDDYVFFHFLPNGKFDFFTECILSRYQTFKIVSSNDIDISLSKINPDNHTQSSVS